MEVDATDDEADEQGPDDEEGGDGSWPYAETPGGGTRELRLINPLVRDRVRMASPGDAAWFGVTRYPSCQGCHRGNPR